MEEIGLYLACVRELPTLPHGTPLAALGGNQGRLCYGHGFVSTCSSSRASGGWQEGDQPLSQASSATKTLPECCFVEVACAGRQHRLQVLLLPAGWPCIITAVCWSSASSQVRGGSLPVSGCGGENVRVCKQSLSQTSVGRSLLTAQAVPSLLGVSRPRPAAIGEAGTFTIPRAWTGLTDGATSARGAEKAGIRFGELSGGGGRFQARPHHTAPPPGPPHGSSIPTRPTHSHTQDTHCSPRTHPTTSLNAHTHTHTASSIRHRVVTPTWKPTQRPRSSSFLPETRETRIPQRIPMPSSSCFRRC